MAKSYYSTVFEQTADEVWNAVRAFDAYQWADRNLSAVMEDGKVGDAVGGIRRVESDGQTIRQRLLAHSDVERFYSYEFCDPAPLPVVDYMATLRITPVVDGARALSSGPPGSTARWRTATIGLCTSRMASAGGWGRCAPN